MVMMVGRDAFIPFLQHIYHGFYIYIQPSLSNLHRYLWTIAFGCQNPTVAKEITIFLDLNQQTPSLLPICRASRGDEDCTTKLEIEKQRCLDFFFFFFSPDILRITALFEHNADD